jgi:transcriptional regulator with GAF, ATPase, and Fis domain
MSQERWLLERAMSLTESLMADRKKVRLVNLPPGGAKLLEIERAALVAALEQAGWNQAIAAKLLSITPRAMNYKVKRFNLYDESPHMKRGAGGPRGRHRAPTPRKAGNDWRTKSWR